MILECSGQFWSIKIIRNLISVYTIKEDTYIYIYIPAGARGGVVVKAVRYKPTGRGFYSRWCHWNFSVT